MHKPKTSLKEIFISPGAGGGEQSSTSGSKKSIYNKKKTKSFHPPIEAHWQLSPLKERPKSHHRLITMLSNSFKSLRRTRSTKLVLEGSHNPKDEKIVDSFRELLFLEGHFPGTYQFDYHTLLRFLRMRDFDLMAAKEAFTRYIKWREEFGIDAISKEFNYEESHVVKRCYPHGYHGVDRYGRPIYIERIGMIDLDTFLQVTTIDRFVKRHVYEQERTMNWRFPACSLAAKKHIASMISILDVKDVGVSRFSKPARHIFMEIQKIDSNYYPETLHRLFIINAGSGFRVLWKAVRAFIDSRTLAKIRVLGTNYKSSLIEAIDPSNLPSFLGGECTCSEYDGGCLFSDRGPWNDPEISGMLREMLYTEAGEEKDGREGKNLINVNSSTEEESVGVDMTLLRRVQAFEPVLENVKEKIRMLEIALEDTKLVLQGLEQHLGELKR
ncbi:hypothetical protein CASFOL_028826 [Castilleja foliolosa]|uniref:CRAL-TRIO domain-containing protein n=1 Tax=Castilleja foliolosa TaxID=1961234 RepID=A0ABD3CC90_9LAMI